VRDEWKLEDLQIEHLLQEWEKKKGLMSVEASINKKKVL
jgi:hypothetical protein